jgi:HD-GYP domain-containing protein (c-di-GMP phosphodiesterase class II)
MTDRVLSDRSAGAAWRDELILPPESIELGHFIVRLDIPWLQTPFPLYGVRVVDERTRQWFVEHCQWVVVDPSRSGSDAATIAGDDQSPEVESIDPSHPRNSLRGSRLDLDSVSASLKAYSMLDRQARQMIRASVDRGAAEVKLAEKTVSELSNYLQRNLAAMVWLTRLKDADDYGAKHSINCAILALGLAHALEWSRRRTERAGLAALLHDVGNVAVDGELLGRKGPLSPAEFRQVQQHTLEGFRRLSEDPSIHRDVAMAARDHHERLDGSGYPKGLRGEEISPIARLIAVVDVFDALTSERPYRPARSHHDALGVLWRGRGREFDEKMIEAFVQFMGWVAPGSLVRLSDQSLAIVEEVNIGQGMKPVVRRLKTGPAGYQVAGRVDLSAQGEGAPGDQLRIDEILPDGAEGLKVKALLVAMLDGDG